MALPIAHAAAGYLVQRVADRASGTGGALRETWHRAALFMFIGNVPDLDFLIGFVLGRPGLVHRGVSHTVLAAVVFGLVAGAVAHWRGREKFLPAALAFGAAYASHILVDFLTIDSRPPAGGQFLWPFSEAYLTSPVTIFGEIYIDGTSRPAFLRTVLAWPTVVVCAREAMMAGGAIGTWHAIEWWRERSGVAAELGAVEEDLV